jgi:hypothetical protein
MDRLPIPDEKPIVPLVGQDGNAFAILGRAKKAMEHFGWSKELIDQYLTEAKSGDYDHLLRVTMEYTYEPEDEEEEW